MKLNFTVNYRTEWGESLFLTGSPLAMGAGDLSRAVPMKLEGSETWTVRIDVPDTETDFTYGYIVRHDNGYVKREWGKPRRFIHGPNTHVFNILDRWQDMPWDKPYYSSAFIDCICHRGDRDGVVAPTAGMLTLSVDAPMIAPDEVVAVSGEAESLGEWNPAKAVRMSDASYPTWSVNIPSSSIKEGSEYKFLILKKTTGEVVAWEGCDSRRFDFTPSAADASIVDAGQRLVNPLAPWRGAGVAIPVFSLRSDEDFGVGDFLDLKLMIDWAVQTRQNFVQLLPINDTTMTGTWTDSYPYKANSIFALHPMYLRLSAMGRLADEERQRYFENLGRELNRLPQVDYERVNNGKNEFTRELFAQDGHNVLSSDEFRVFFEKNASWLTPYAAWCVLRDINHTPDMAEWGEYAVYDAAKVENFINEHRSDVDYVYYIQYFLDRQMREVRDYAHSCGVAIKGDIPIGISRTSVDAWISPRLFNLDCQAGAPPDDFSVLGQNWGLPTYNWEEMSKDGFAWWKDRFRKMAEYFDAYRIDHVLGFFRIWQIPMDAVHGLLGIFNQAVPFTPDELRNSYDFWIDVDRQTKPYIMDYMLADFFGEDAVDECRDRFLIDEGYGRYRLREEFDTQRKVVDYFSHEENNDRNNRICNALLGLIDEVLFIEDPYEKGKYHPRISAQFTYAYRALNDYERWCFNRMYNDFFYRRNNDFWYGKAMWKLPPLIDATDMLVCAEDLGMIPACVPAVMNNLQILELEIQRMPKDPSAAFGNTWTYPYRSVCTTSTHDMDGIRRWWEADRNATQRFYNEILGEAGPAPQYAEPWICERIVKLHLQSPSMLCILPLQDWLSIDGVLRRQDPREELINIPANPRHYWRYRMHLTLEDLNSQKEFNNRLREEIIKSGR